MKIIPVLLLSVLAFPASAANLLSALEQHQASLTPEPGVTQERPPTGVTSPSSRPSDVDSRCEEDKQTSLPLKYLTGLLLQRDAKLDINHNPASGSLRVSSAAKMIGNCNSMLEWSMRENEIDGQKTYALEVKFKEGETCPEGTPDAGDKKCFRFAVMKDGSFEKFDRKPFSNDIRGFQSCLEASGVVSADGRVNNDAIFKQPVQESFSGLDETGKLVFLSHGPVSSQIDPRFGLERVNRCDVYERIHPTVSMVYSSSDLENQRLQQQAEELRNCTPNEYQRLVDFIERNNYVGDLNAIRDDLIKQAAQVTARKISENRTLEDDDLKVIGDFERYIIEPLRLAIGEKFNQIESLPDSEKPAARAELQALKNQLQAYARAPYFQRAHVEKLISQGRFDDAEKMEGIRITIGEAGKIGNRNGNQVITPEQARVAIANARGALTDTLSTERENYDIRHGVITDRSATYRNLAQQMRQNIQRRTQNYSQEIQNEYARVQQGGYCYRYFRNTQKCIQDSLQRIQELQNALTHYNNLDQERAAQFDQQANEYAEMETEGRRNRAIANGEPVPEQQPQDTTVVPPRTDQQAAAQMVPQQMMTPQQPYQNPMMMQMNPYSNMYGQQQGGMMGQAGFSAGFGYQGTGGQNFMGMPQQYGNVGMNWFAMGQQAGQSMMGQPMMGMQSPYGQMYGQSPYMQQPMMGQMGMGMNFGMPQAFSYPSFF